MSIQWMSHNQHGHYPCSNSQEIVEFKKAGWSECGPPSTWGKQSISGGQHEKSTGDVRGADHVDSDDGLDNLTEDASAADAEAETDPREKLLAEASARGIAVDHRWGIFRLRKALGIKG